MQECLETRQPQLADLPEDSWILRYRFRVVRVSQVLAVHYELQQAAMLFRVCPLGWRTVTRSRTEEGMQWSEPLRFDTIADAQRHARLILQQRRAGVVHREVVDWVD